MKHISRSELDDQTIETVGLTYVSDAEPGILRQRRGLGFCYRLPGGRLLRDPEIRARIQALGLPPAYKDVWICLDPAGHLQATGFDQRGRKQYRYHPEWQTWRSSLKYQDLATFAHTLPRIRRRIAADLDHPVDDAHFLLAGLTALLDATHLRIGNRAYARENRTYGATTLLKRHLRFGTDGISLRFIAKGGKRVQRQLKHPRLQRILEEIADLPGRELFSWLDDEGDVRRIDSGRLNAYLRQISGGVISAKTFRTWGGTLAAFKAAQAALLQDQTPTIKTMCEAAAEALHNTPAICRTSYVHPLVLALSTRTTSEERSAFVAELKTIRPQPGLRKDEARLRAFLEPAA